MRALGAAVDRDDGREAIYRANIARLIAARVPAAVSVLAACAATATVFELLRFPDRRPWMLGADAVYVAIIAVLVALARRESAWTTAAVVGAVNVLSVILNGYHAAVNAPPAYCIWVLTALLSSSAVLLPWGWRCQVLACVGMAVSYPVLLLSSAADPLSWGAGGAYLGWVVGLSALAAASLEHYLRSDFDLSASLAEREARLRSYFDLALVGSAVLQQDGSWAEVNDELCRIVGRSRADVVARRWDGLLDEADVQLGREAFARALGGDEARGTYELRLRRANGETVHASVGMRPLPAPGGGVDHVLLLVLDITERKAVEEALRRDRAAAEADSRSKSTLLATVTHELRNPISVITGMTDIILDGDLTPEQRRALTLTKRATTTVAALVNDVLDLSRLDLGGLVLRPRAVDVRGWLSEVLEPLFWLARAHGLILASDVADAVSDTIVVDPERLRQVIVNLVDNAFKFTERGEVRIIVTQTSPGAVVFTVSDTGRGIPEPQQAMIFDAFVQVGSRGGRAARGTGLGLAICRQLVLRMGGDIRVESRPGFGSRFHVTVPCTPPAALADADVARAAVAGGSPSGVVS